MAQAKGPPFGRTQVGEPIAGAEPVTGAAQTVTRGGKGPEHGFGSRVQMAVQQAFPLGAHEADGHGAGVQVETPGKWVLRGVEAPEVSSSCVRGSCPQASRPLGSAEGEAAIMIKDLQAIRLQRIVDAYTLLQRVAQGMSPTDYARVSTGVEAPSSAYATLLQQMDEAFLAHGPVRYPADAVDYAKALILSSLGIEPNTELKTIVNRYRQNPRRAGTSSPPLHQTE